MKPTQFKIFSDLDYFLVSFLRWWCNTQKQYPCTVYSIMIQVYLFIYLFKDSYNVQGREQ